jgi:flagellar export protein FliJ
MPREKYRLQTVLEIRDKAKKEAAQLVGVRRGQLASAEEELERCHQAVRDNLQKQREQQDLMFAEINRGVEARRAMAFRTHLTDLREVELDLRANVVKQEKVVRQAEIELEKALEFLAEATKEVKVIEKHKETWRLNTKLEAERKEQKLNDEIGQILYSPKVKH